MRLSLRFVLPLMVMLGLIAYMVVPLIDILTLKWFSRDLDMRTQLLISTAHDPLALYIQEKSNAKITKLFNRMIKDERLYALGLCNATNQLTVKTQTFPDLLGCEETQRP